MSSRFQRISRPLVLFLISILQPINSQWLRGILNSLQRRCHFISMLHPLMPPNNLRPIPLLVIVIQLPLRALDSRCLHIRHTSLCHSTATRTLILNPAPNTLLRTSACRHTLFSPHTHIRRHPMSVSQYRYRSSPRSQRCIITTLRALHS